MVPYTYQDFLKVRDDETEKFKFVRSAITVHQKTEAYEEAYVADQYNKHRNVTITEYQKLLYTVTGKAVPDNFSANFKMASRHFHRFVVQENQYLLGNGASWDKDGIEDKLGTKKKPFDTQLQKLGKNALIHGTAFGFWNFDHLDVFSLLEFVPLYDEEDGALKAGIRFWQIDNSKPLRATLYEEDGYTEVIWKVGEQYEILQQKRAYKISIRESEIDGAEIYDWENYPTFPIVPLWANSEKQSELVGLREQIDCYDLIKSGFANTVDEASYVYWTIQNAGGMDDVDLAKFVEKMKTVHAAVIDQDGATAESHQQDAPFESREALLTRLERDMYKDAMALDVESIASGAATATQIRAAYEPLNVKCDDYEYCIREFIQSILELTGLDAEVSFTRSMIINVAEDINSVLAAANYLSQDYITKKVLDILGDGDQADEMIKEMTEEDVDRFMNNTNEEKEEENDNNGFNPET